MKGLLLWTYGTWLVVEFLCVNVSILSATGAPIGVKKTTSFSDIAFDEQFLLHNKTVSCSASSASGSKYPNPMYTCSDISVDGVRLYHGYTEGTGKAACRNCPCGVTYGRQNDIHILCREMLKAHSVSEMLIAAYVVKPTCGLSKEAQPRIKFYLNEKGLPTWDTVETKNGYINTLQCLTEKPKPKS